MLLLLSTASIAFAGEKPDSSPAQPDAVYTQSYEKWKVHLTENLKNWSSLAGLFWLKPGANSFGTDPGNAIVFPKGPAHAGEFDLEGDQVTIKLRPEAHATIGGKPATTAKLESGHVPTEVKMESLDFYVITRQKGVGIRVEDQESETMRNFPGLTFFPLDMNYRVTAQWVPGDGKATIEVPDVIGDTYVVTAPGVAVFTIDGKQVRLTACGGDPSKGLIFYFNDLTEKTNTYPGGRSIGTRPVENGTVVLDFNRASNPPCSVTPYATCPLAPKENRLSVAIPAGQKFDRTGHAHQ
jgi:uncharacterized protein (DUF1684 family)